MAKFSGQVDGRFLDLSVCGRQEDNFADEDDEDDSSLSQCHGDGIRRNYLQNIQNENPKDPSSRYSNCEPIHVTLDEGYFARERRALLNGLANVRQKITSIRLFDPTKNQMENVRSDHWNEKEKHTLDSLNEFKSHLDDKFQWNRPEDGRKVWVSKTQYFLAITSYSIGLGNVIRFPILVQKNGGLAFIIPFLIMLIVEGIPLFYLELAVGQRMRKAAISCWNLVSPFAAGIGIASAVVSFVIGLYYNTMVAWTLVYLWGSASKTPLPYTVCPNASFVSLTDSPSTWARTEPTAANLSENECQDVGSFQFYWYRQTLNTSTDVSDWANFNWQICICLMVAWMISYLCLVRGLSSSRRVVYVASTFPYVILTIFFFKALSLDGMSDGIYYLLKPKWSKLADPYVWLQSAAQVFFSLGLGFGGLIALSSYNPVNNNCFKDAIKVSLINFFTSIYAGLVIFAILDYTLKVLDYGSVFKPVVNKGDISNLDSTLNLNSSQSSSGQPAMGRPTIVDNAPANNEDYEYDSSDAIASIKSLDRQLDLVKSNVDYGDSDVEFILDASTIISKEDLAQVISSIQDLPQCSIKKELDESTRGTGLVFVVMTQAISYFENGPTWATIFFLMLLTLGLDSQFGNLEGLLSSLTDLNYSQGLGRQCITGIICGISLILSIVFFSHGAGSYMFQLFDEYSSNFSLVLIAVAELVAIAYIYGLQRFCDDCELMTGRRPPFFIILSWRFISPILLLIVLVATIKEFSVSVTYEAWVEGVVEEKQWPFWCLILASIFIIICVIWIPSIAILKILKIDLLPIENLSRCWFPVEELREYHNLQDEHVTTKLERIVFGFRDYD